MKKWNLQSANIFLPKWLGLLLVKLSRRSRDDLVSFFKNSPLRGETLLDQERTKDYPRETEF